MEADTDEKLLDDGMKDEEGKKEIKKRGRRKTRWRKEGRKERETQIDVRMMQRVTGQKIE